MTQTLQTLWDESETCNMKHTDDDEQRDHKTIYVGGVMNLTDYLCQCGALAIIWITIL